jgi:hypothetical protein
MHKEKELTRDSVIVKRHSRQLWVDVSAFDPPFEKVFVLHVFRLGGQVACKLIDCAFRNCAECRQVIEDVICCCRLVRVFRLYGLGKVVSETIRTVVFGANDIFRRRDPAGNPASMLKVSELVARV